MSPSLSRSTGYMHFGPSTVVSVTNTSVKFSLPSFLYQAILSSFQDAESTSISPSPSISAENTSQALSAEEEMTCSVKLSEPLFSYQAILSSFSEAEITSISPSRSMSAACTALAPNADVDMEYPAKLPAPSFSYQVISLLLRDEDSTSISPSPSTSEANTLLAISTSELIIFGANTFLTGLLFTTNCQV